MYTMAIDLYDAECCKGKKHDLYMNRFLAYHIKDANVLVYWD